MKNKVLLAIVLILIGVFVLLDNFDYEILTTRTVMFAIVGLIGINLFSKYQSSEKVGTLYWAVSLTLSSALFFTLHVTGKYYFIPEEAILASILAVFGIGWVVISMVEKTGLYIIPGIPFFILAVLNLNNTYMFWDAYYYNFGLKAFLGTGLVSLGLYFMISLAASQKAIENKENSF
jgi:hypothetical protein